MSAALQPVDQPVATESLTVSVVVCAYTMRRWTDLQDAVASLACQGSPPEEILVVIDGPDDELYGMAVSAFAGPTMRVVRNGGPRGLSGARNTGVKLAVGDVVGFLDDDAIALPGWASRLREHFVHPQVAAVGGHAEPAWPGARPGWMPREFDWVVGCGYTGQPTRVTPVRNVIGCNMAFRKNVFAIVGGFDQSVGRVGRDLSGCEETELCIRIRQQIPGAQVLHDPELQVRHTVTPDRATVSYFVRRCFGEGRSKAVVAQLSGTGDALESERAYVSKVLPAGVARGLTDALHPGDRTARLAGPARSAMIAAGLLTTTAGYARGRAAQLLRRRGRS